MQEGIRLQKALAQAGIASRRACEGMIQDGKITVNGSIVTTLGTRINPRVDVVCVDGKQICLQVDLVYYIFNKPQGVESTNSPRSQNKNTKTLHHFTKDLSTRVYSIGRLDIDTTGLLLLTNDGDFAHKMSHPSFLVEKEYIAHIEGTLKNASCKALLEGIELEDGLACVDRIERIATFGNKTIVRVALHSGRNRIVRRIFAHIGHRVIDLARVRYGDLKLGSLPLGKMRMLTRFEIGALRANARK